MKYLFVIFVLLVKPIAFTQDLLETYPENIDGLVRKSIELPKKKNEKIFKIEIIVSKRLDVDKCNKHFLSGGLDTKTLEGWGYNYYQFSGTDQVFSTLMGCPDNTKVSKDIYGKSILIDYNNKLPLVVYVPKDMKVEYKIWKLKNKSFLFK